MLIGIAILIILKIFFEYRPLDPRGKHLLLSVINICLNYFSIYLVDHAWTFKPESARHQLNTYPGLLERMTELLDIEVEELKQNREKLVDAVMAKKWQIAQTYSIGNSDATVEEKMPVWYIIDEFAARIQHSDKPNFRMVPFFCMLDNCAYSLLFPIRYYIYIHINKRIV